MTVQILIGDCRDVLRTLPDESVHCCVTSPPYFGLRDYGVAGQIGLESSPEAFVSEMVAAFREVRRVLRADGTCWINLGDSYNNSDKWGGGGVNTGKHTKSPDGSIPSWSGVRRKWSALDGLKPKDLMGVPWMVAFALRADGWYLRQDIIWSKPNPMPESVRDRCTKAHEYLFLLSKSERYYYDADAIKEPAAYDPADTKFPDGWDTGAGGHGAFHRNGREKGRKSGNKSHKYVTAYEGAGGEEHRTKAGLMKAADTTYPMRNKRSVWSVGTEAFPDAHFATFPPALIEPCILAGCPEFTCSECGTALDSHIKNAIRSSTNGNALRSLRDGIRQAAISTGADAVLQSEVHGGGSNDREDGGALRLVRQACDSGPKGSGAEFLQQSMCVQMDGEEQAHDQGKIHHVEGVCGDIQAGSSERVEGRLCDGASTCNGSEDRPGAIANGNCPPQERRQNREPREQSGSLTEDSARQIAEDTDGENPLSALRRIDPSVPTCPRCEADLTRVGAIVPGTVLDCFGGAGTTALVADRHGRNSILIELNPEYAAMAQRRVEGDAGMFAQVEARS